MKLMTKTLTKSIKRLSLMTLILTISQSAIAHTQWLKPSVFNTALNGKTVWISGQLSMSEYAFNTERGLSGKVTITQPNNKKIIINDLYTGKTSSLFELELTQAGTYKIETLIGPSISKPRKPMLVAKAEPKTKIESKIEKKAKPRPITRSVSRLTSYVTADAPSYETLNASKQWLDITPITHPGDIVAGEPARFLITYQGKPLADQSVTLVPSGGEYKNQSIEQEYMSNSQGEIQVDLATAGVYLLKSRYQFDLENDPQAKIMRCSAGLTFEAQLN